MACAADVVLTPHPGEAARLLATTSREIETDRLAAAQALAERSKAVIVLKGARTIVCDGRTPQGMVTINCTGNPALATAGSGDVLTGMIAALAARGLDLADAARVGVYVHGLTADLLADDMAVLGVTATDLCESIPRAMAQIIAD